MSSLAGMSADTRNKAIAIAVFVLLAGGILYWEVFSGATTNTPSNAPVAVTPAASVNARPDPAADDRVAGESAAAAGRPARRVATGSAALDPALRMGPMLAAEQVAYSGIGRNIFSQNSAPPVIAIPKPIAPVRPVQPVSPPPQIRSGPPPPPPIDLTFFGTETDSAGRRLAILLHDDAVYTAQAGDVVLRRYKIVAVDARTIQVEDMVTNNKQTLPLVAN